METKQTTSATDWQRSQECSNRLLMGAAHSAATMGVAATHFRVSICPTIQRQIIAPQSNGQYGWEAGWQLQVNSQVLDPMIEGVIRAAGLLGQKIGEARHDRVSRAEMDARYLASVEWYERTIEYVGDAMITLAREVELVRACTFDLFQQARQLEHDDCRVITVSSSLEAALRISGRTMAMPAREVNTKPGHFRRRRK